MMDKANISKLFEKAKEELMNSDDSAVDNAIKEIIKIERESYMKNTGTKSANIKKVILENHKNSTLRDEES
jgi:hypothetical protein